MRTRLRSKVTLLFLTCAMLIAVPAVAAFADLVGNNLDTDSLDNQRETVNLASHGKSATVEMYIQASTGSGDADDGCNFDTSTEKLKLRVFEQSDPNNAVSSVVWDEPGATTTTTTNDTIEYTGCDNPATTAIENGQTVKVTSANVSPATGTTFDANIDFAEVSNNTGGTFDTQTGRFMVKVAKDVTPPDTNITAGPADGSTVNSNSATFEFTSTEANSTFECKLDTGSFAACTSPKVLSSLGDGSRNFQVRAIDAAGNVDASPATRTWTVQTDSTPPTSSASGTVPDGNDADTNRDNYTAGAWTNQDVEVTLTGQDNTGGSGLKEIRYTTDGTAPTKTSGTVYSAPFTVSSTTTVKFLAVDNAGNAEAVKSFQVNIDKVAPAPNCGSADGAWHASDVSISCSPSDSGGSGLASGVPATITLVTNVQSGTQDANASTNSQTISDVAGNTATAGPISGNMVDKKAPGFSCDPAPTGWQNDNVSIDCTASDGGSGLNPASDATFQLSTNVAAGSETNNASTGTKTLTDAIGNSVTAPAITGIQVDRKAPNVQCGSADGNWHAANVDIGCTATDGGSGLASTGDASFNLSTTVADGTETNNASTGSRDVYDMAGNKATAGPIGGNMVDRKAPAVVPGDVNDTTWRNSPLPPVNFTASDGGSGLAANQGLGAGGSFTLTASAESTKDSNGNPVPTTVSKTVSDAVGNSTTRKVSALIDLTVPNISASILNNPAGTGWYNLSTGGPQVDFECSDALSGIQSCPDDYTITEEGSNVGYSGTAYDVAGNSKSVSGDGLKVDLTEPAPPSAIDLLSDSGANTNDDITNDRTPEFSVKAEPGSTVELFYQTTSGLVSVGTGTANSTTGVVSITVPAGQALADGNYTFVAKATDPAGNVSLVSNDASLTVKVESNITVDGTAPDTSIGTKPDSFSNNASPSFSFSSTEANSTFEMNLDGQGWVDNGSTTSKSYSGLADGSHTFQVRATDVAGNTDGTPASYTWTVDTVAPNVQANASRSADANGWYNHAFTVSFQGTDTGGSGIASCDPAVTYGDDASELDGTGLTLSGSCTDKAGNSAQATFTFKYDATAPGITNVGADSTFSTPNAAGWYKTDVRHKFSATDNLSGFAGGGTTLNFSKDISQEGTAVTISSGTVTDLAGNVATAITSSPAYKIDKTAPTLNPTVSPNPVVLNGTATANPGASDPNTYGSGIASASCGPVDTSTAGPHSVSCSATDNAGNSNNASAQYSVAFKFVGFSAPVDNNNVLNSAKAGQAIPLKWQLLDANNVPVTNLAGVKVTVASLSCSLGTTTDLLEEYAAGSSGLQNLGGGYYQFNWKSPTTYANSCKTLHLDLGEGKDANGNPITRTALFKFTK